MEGHLLMSEKERRRKSVFEEVERGRLTLVAASDVLGLSYRQCRRSYRRFGEEGDAGLVHRSRGHASNRGYDAGFRAKVVARYESRYAGFGPTLAAEKLAAEGFEMDHETLRRWLLDAGLWTKRRRRARHRQWRARKAHRGELVQMDGSHHAWFGPEHGRCCLMSMVDDATGERMALLAEEETTEVAMRMLWAWIDRHGIPQALYTDRKNVYVTEREPTLEEQLADRPPLTAFGAACAKLGIRIITARSAPAKGRVERDHGVYQDRLVKELALRGITTIATANRLLANGFVDALNAKFAVAPAEPEDYHRPVPAGLDLGDVFCFEETRVVQNDWTLRHHNRHYQILETNRPLPKPKDQVTVRTRLDGSVHLLYCHRPLDYRKLTKRDLRTKAAPRRPTPPATPQRAVKKRRSAKPGADHPWRHNCTLMAAEPSA